MQFKTTTEGRRHEEQSLEAPSRKTERRTGFARLAVAVRAKYS